MTRGQIVVVATRGADTNKPRSVIVLQANLFNDAQASVTVCPVTSDCIDAPLFRIPLPPGERTGHATASQAMVDKVVSVPRPSIGKVVGHCSIDELDAIGDALRRWLDL